jgi:hypothetical protein
MNTRLSRRDFVKAVGLAGIGTAIYSVDGWGRTATDAPNPSDPIVPATGFSFVQMSDTHWGFSNPAINPDFAGTLKKAISQVNSLPRQPDFIVFTGDLTQTTDDDGVRRKRMNEFREIIKDLHVTDIHFLPGEHDAGLDNGQAFEEIFGKTHYSFDHKGVHFVALDNVSDPHASLGDAQLQWLSSDLKALDKGARLIVLTHRPLFDLAPDWDWATTDGARAIEMLAPFSNVAVIYGHIHQVNHYSAGNIQHHSAMGLMWPLPAPHSIPKKAPIPWDPTHPYKGLGLRSVQTNATNDITEMPLAAVEKMQVVKITAKKFEFDPRDITLKKGVPVVLELTSLDRLHGFSCPGLGIRTDIAPGKTSTLNVVPDKTGTFTFHCDVFCGTGHEHMTGTITVAE